MLCGLTPAGDRLHVPALVGALLRGQRQMPILLHTLLCHLLLRSTGRLHVHMSPVCPCHAVHLSPPCSTLQTAHTLQHLWRALLCEGPQLA